MKVITEVNIELNICFTPRELKKIKGQSLAGVLFPSVVPQKAQSSWKTKHLVQSE